MFVLTTLVYPVVLALLCFGAGMLVDRASGGVLPAMLFPVAGAAALIVVSQLSTYATFVAPATPYLLAGVAVGGFLSGVGGLRWRGRRARTRTHARQPPFWQLPTVSPSRALARARHLPFWPLLLAPIAYALALAPVLLATRPTFSSYLALADSAVHMVGADFLIHHGQDYSHLDLHNSYGATISAYYDTSYPSGADTLLGGSSRLLGLPLIWTFQPFTAFMLATATGPAWVLARRIGLDGVWAAMAALTMTLPALVYAYELIGSVKEIVALPLILGMGALVVEHRRWLWTGARGAIPFALLVAAGVGVLGVAFGAWALVATLVLVAVAIGEPARRTIGLVAGGALVLLVGALPTWVNLSGSLSVAQGIASTSNPGNLHSPLHPTQLFGVWLGGSYKLLPTGVSLTLTSVLVALVFVAVVAGVGNAVRSGWYALAGWFALTILLWLVLRTYATTWADAKTLMLTSPVVVLMAWAGIASLRASRAWALRIAAAVVAFVLLGGVLASDTLQYHSSNLAPTARYEELASINTRFAGRGATLFTDFDEYALYELRDMDVGGPDFVYSPPALAGAADGHGAQVRLDRIAPSALLAYPLIVTRRDPTGVRPPFAYRLLWQGVYYRVWGRRPGAHAALVHMAVSAPSTRPRAQCSRLAGVARLALSAGTSRVGVRSGAGSARTGLTGETFASARLVAAPAPDVVALPLAGTHRPSGWRLARPGIVMGGSGALHASFRLPRGGIWELWLKGDVMRTIRVSIDSRPLGSLGAQLGGNSLVANTLTPLRARLAVGEHTLTIARSGANLAPGDGGAAVLAGIFLAPAGPAGQPTLMTVPAARWRSLCGRALQWVELVSTP